MKNPQILKIFSIIKMNKQLNKESSITNEELKMEVLKKVGLYNQFIYFFCLLSLIRI